MESSTIFFSLDSDGTQFGTEEIGTGLRGGYAWVTDDLSLFFLLNYFTNLSLTDENDEDTQTITYTDY